MGLTRTQAFPWAAKYPDFNRPFCGGPERPHLCNPVLSSTVVAQEPVEDVQAAGVQPEAGSSPSIVTEPMDWRRRTCPISWRRTGETGKIQVGGASAPSPTHPHHPGSQVIPGMPRWYSLMITLFLKDGVVPKGRYQLAAGLGMA